MHPKTTYERVRFEGFELDLGSGELFYEGRKVQLQEQPFQVLRSLLEHSGQLVTREQLRHQLWPADTFVDFDHNLNKAVAKLREALETAGAKSSLIETLPRRGYRFIGQIEPLAPNDSTINEDGNASSRQMESETEVPAPAQFDTVIDTVVEDETRNERPKKANRRKLRLWLLPSAAVLAIGLAAVVWYLHRPLPPLRITKYTQITFDGQRKVVSATDGSRLYLGSDSPNVQSQMAASGGDRVPLRITVPGRQFMIRDVSPDGSALLIASLPVDSEVAGLWTQSILGGTVQRLVESESGGFSPDGKSVAYVSRDHTEIDVVNLDGTGARRLASPGPGVERPRWSPDGKSIRFERNGKLWEISSTGTDLNLVLPGWNVPGEQLSGRWSPDGRFYFFLVGGWGGQIWAIDERRRLPWQHAAEPVQLTSEPIRWGEPIPGKGGKTIYTVGETRAGTLMRFDQKTGLFAPFLGGISAEFVSFSRDGKSVAYVSFPEGILWRANRDGSNRMQLTYPPLYPSNPRWSPDGKQIIFMDFRGFGNSTSYTVSSDGGKSPEKLMPDNPGLDGDPGWSPDGREIVFHENLPVTRTEDIRVLDLATHRVTTIPGSAGMYSPRWSADGRYIAALARVGPFLRVFNIAAQKWTVLKTTGIVAFPWFSSDSQTIYFLRYGVDQEIFRIHIPDGKEERVADLSETHLVGAAGASMSLDPTDAPLLTRAAGTDDVYVLTLDRK
jgi:Tol biopolymer transport system component/DNA-binding winged helix-turn-helix (wHTH) protein